MSAPVRDAAPVPPFRWGWGARWAARNASRVLAKHDAEEAAVDHLLERLGRPSR